MERLEKDYPGRTWQATGKSDPRRIRTGIFNIDRLLGGGLPVNRLTLLYGKESTYKTTTALKIIRNLLQRCGQCFLPYEVCTCLTPDDSTIGVLIDIDHGFEEKYITNLGIDPKRIYVHSPSHGEAACEVAKEFASVPEVRGIIVDTLANMISIGTLEKGFVDGIARGERAALINRMIRSLIVLLDSEIPRVGIMINHPMPKVDGRVGSYLPGGETQTKASSVIIQFWTLAKSKSEITVEKELKDDLLLRRQEIGF